MSLGFVSVDLRNSKAVIDPQKTDKYEYLPGEKRIRIALSNLTKEELRTKELAIGILRVDFAPYLTDDQERNIQRIVNGVKLEVVTKIGYANGTTQTFSKSFS